MTTAVATPVELLLQLSAGYYISRAFHSVANLGVADELDAAPQPAAALASRLGADPAALERVIRALSLYGVFEYRDGMVAHTAASRMLRADHPQSMLSLVRMFALPGFWTAVGELESSVRTGAPSADRALPGGFWGYLARNPDASRVFGEAMTAKAHAQVAGVLASYNFSSFKTIADVGGGRGHLIQAILARTPSADGVLFDQPHVVKEASGIASDRLGLVGGNFFEDPLPAADAYILMEVIHDWDDDASLKILRAVHRAAPRGAKVLLVEMLLPETETPNWPTTLDIVMLTIGGRQRTPSEYAQLLQQAGFSSPRYIDTPTGVTIIEAVRS